MKIGIIGTRGIPNHYGGFEEFAEGFSTRMVERGHEVTVYSSHRHNYTAGDYKNVRLIHCYDPEHRIGTAGQFIYDLNCIRNSRKQNFDVILQLGYTSSTIWSWLFPGSSILATNMDGLEWMRAKYNRPTKYFLTHAEKWGVRYSDHLIADSKGIQDYLADKYKVDSVLVPYGADIYEPSSDPTPILQKYELKDGQYDVQIARFEPENNLEEVLKAYVALSHRNLVLIGNYAANKYGQRLFRKYGNYPQIKFMGANYNVNELNVLRYHSSLYVHGHSVGGTNPSLLGAMACSTCICAHDNLFNRFVLGSDAFYFRNASELQDLLLSAPVKEAHTDWLKNNKQKIATFYNWDTITDTLESLFKQWKYGEQTIPIDYSLQTET